MSARALLFSFLLTLAAVSPGAMPGLPVAAATRAGSTMVVEPSSASLAGGKARLTTSALRRAGGKYVGDYQLKVIPYFYKNESGTLSIVVNEETMSKLCGGLPVSFAGNATTAGTKKMRTVSVKAIPAAAGSAKGTLVMTIATENGEVVFRAGYLLSGD